VCPICGESGDAKYVISSYGETVGSRMDFKFKKQTNYDKELISGKTISNNNRLSSEA
jgi:hypothetical protein